MSDDTILSVNKRSISKQEDAMIEVHVNYYFKNNADRDSFYKEASEAGIIAASKAEAGNIRYDYFIPMDEDGRIYLLEQWKNQEELDKHCAMEHFARLGAIKQKYVINFERVQYDGVGE